MILFKIFNWSFNFTNYHGINEYSLLNFSSLLSLWRAIKVIKSINIKEKAKIIAFISFILIISLLVINNLDLFLFYYEIVNKTNNNKNNSNINEMTVLEFFILYWTYTVLQLIAIIGIFLWYNLKFRINYGKKSQPNK